MPIRAEMKARYPKDWKLRSYFVRFVRGKGKCEKCGIPHGAIRDKDDPDIWFTINDGHAADSWFLGREDRASKVVLTCAHVYDHRPEAASLLNLAGWCQRCHNRHDAKMRAVGIKERRKNDNQTELFGELF